MYTCRSGAIPRSPDGHKFCSSLNNELLSSIERHFCNLCSETLDSIAAAHVAIQINKLHKVKYFIL